MACMASEWTAKGLESIKDLIVFFVYDIHRSEGPNVQFLFH